jgi:hypothetical protein
MAGYSRRLASGVIHIPIGRSEMSYEKVIAEIIFTLLIIFARPLDCRIVGTEMLWK